MDAEDSPERRRRGKGSGAPSLRLGGPRIGKIGAGGVKTDGRRGSVRGLVVAARNNREGAKVGGQRNHTPAEERGVRARRGRGPLALGKWGAPPTRAGVARSR